MEIINKPANLRVMLLEKKKEKLVGRALNDQTVSSYTSKYRLRVEYVLTEFEDDKAEESQRVKFLNFTKLTVLSNLLLPYNSRRRNLFKSIPLLFKGKDSIKFLDIL
jgi:hypothetical protein